MSYPEYLTAEEKLADGKRRLNIPEVVVICGSTRFMQLMTDADRELTAAGYIVVKPGCDMKTPHPLWADPADAERLKVSLDDLHRAKIRLADIGQLTAGWLDGQGEAISGNTILQAGRLAEALPANLRPLAIFPTEPGGIEIEWRDQHGAHGITVNPDSTLFLLSNDPADATEAAPTLPVPADGPEGEAQ